MASYRFAIEAVTPLFLGGAKQSQAELRAPSIKGALRFWFRAMMGEDLLKERSSATEDKESRLFGSTNHKSAVVLRVGNLTGSQQNLANLGQELGYLGYGALAYEKDTKSFKATRPCYEPQTEFALTAEVSDDRSLRLDFLRSLWLLCNLGGLGSRSRRGFGSLQVIRVEPQNEAFLAVTTADTPAALKARLEQGLRAVFQDQHPSQRPLPCFSAITGTSGIYVYHQDFPSWQEALKAIGGRMQDYRLRGPRSSATSHGESDYDKVRRFLDTGIIHDPPLRAAFGLPHNYYFSSRAKEKRRPWKASFSGKQHDRRASPLLIHVTRLASSRFAIVLTYLKARFLEQGESIEARAGDTSAIVGQPAHTAISEFISHLGLSDEWKVRLP